MDTINLVVMGKTGSGKSTLINSVLCEERAPTGTGGAVTREVAVYKKEIEFQPYHANDGKPEGVQKLVKLYDTVGLEIDQSITLRTLSDIRNLLKNTVQHDGDSESTLIWFCISNSSSRFEPYEAELIKSLSVEFEIPFIIVITQCYTDDKGELEKTLEREVPELDVYRVLAKEKHLRTGNIEAFGISRLLNGSIINYDERKLVLLNKKLQTLLLLKSGNDDVSIQRNRDRVNLLRAKGNDIVTKAAVNAGHYGSIILVDKVLYINMFLELNKLFEVRIERARIADILKATYPNGIKSFFGVDALAECYTEIKDGIRNISLPKVKKPNLKGVKPSINLNPKKFVSGVIDGAKMQILSDFAPNENIKRIGKAYLDALCDNALTHTAGTDEYDAEIIRVLEEIMKRERG